MRAKMSNKNPRHSRIFIVSCFQLLAAACSPPEPEIQAETAVHDAAMSNELQGDNLLAYGRTYSEQRFGPLDPINISNVENLSAEWYLDLPRDKGLVSTPR
jgi:glucose dehydrogenase